MSSATRPVSSIASPVRTSSSSVNVNGGRCQRRRSPVPRRTSTADADRRSRDRDRGHRGEEHRREEQRHAPERRPQRARLVPDVERGAAAPEERGGDRRQDGLLEIEALDDVEDRERGQERERDLEGSASAPVEVERRQEERERDRHGERVSAAHHRYRLDADEHVAAPGDVRRDGRDEVDDRDDRDADGGERRDVVQLPRGPEAQGAPVQAEPPRRRVAPGRRQVAPVLDDEPEPGERHAAHGYQPEGADERGHGAQREDGEPEMPFVDPAPEHVHAQAKRMADELQHRWVSASIVRTQLPIGREQRDREHLTET